MTDDLRKELELPLYELDSLDVVGFGGASIPYIGFTKISIGFTQDCCVTALVLIVKNIHRYSLLLGTNVLEELFNDEHMFSDDPVIRLTASVYNWTSCDVKLCDTLIIEPQSRLRTCASVQLSKVFSSPCNVSLEQTTKSGLPSCITVTSSIVTPEVGKRVQELPLELINWSNQQVVLNKSFVAVLTPVKLRGQVNDVSTAEVCSVNVSDDDTGLPEGCLSEVMNNLPLQLDNDQRESVKNLLNKWHSIFPKDDLDLGCATTTEHKITLSDPVSTATPSYSPAEVRRC